MLLESISTDWPRIIAIKGDKLYGNKVIECLIEGGGINQFDYMKDFGYDSDYFYYVNENGLIRSIYKNDIDLNKFNPVKIINYPLS